MAITFTQIVQYLDAVAANPNSRDTANSPHLFFWRTDRDTFVQMNVPNVACPTGGGPTPIKVVMPNDPDNSPILTILSKNRAVCNKRQMPDGGPFLTDAGYQVALPGGQSISGQQILDDVRQWILSGCP